MRMLVTTPAGLGHIHPMVPLAQALASRGHEVLWVERGLEPRPYGGSYDWLYIDIYPPEMQVEAGAQCGIASCCDR